MYYQEFLPKIRTALAEGAQVAASGKLSLPITATYKTISNQGSDRALSTRRQGFVGLQRLSWGEAPALPFVQVDFLVEVAAVAASIAIGLKRMTGRGCSWDTGVAAGSACRARASVPAVRRSPCPVWRWRPVRPLRWNRRLRRVLLPPLAGC